MATITQKPKVDIQATFVLDEDELGAMDALVGYGTDRFLKAFYELMGEAYLKPHEAGLRRLFESFQKSVPGILSRAEKARKAFNA